LQPLQNAVSTERIPVPEAGCASASRFSIRFARFSRHGKDLFEILADDKEFSQFQYLSVLHCELVFAHRKTLRHNRGRSF
jgi:hypothetical protein